MMEKEEQMILRHLVDLANECAQREYPVFSDFLNLNTIIQTFTDMHMSFRSLKS